MGAHMTRRRPLFDRRGLRAVFHTCEDADDSDDEDMGGAQRDQPEPLTDSLVALWNEGDHQFVMGACVRSESGVMYAFTSAMMAHGIAQQGQLGPLTRCTVVMIPAWGQHSTARSSLPAIRSYHSE